MRATALLLLLLAIGASRAMTPRDPSADNDMLPGDLRGSQAWPATGGRWARLASGARRLRAVPQPPPARLRCPSLSPPRPAGWKSQTYQSAEDPKRPWMQVLDDDARICELCADASRWGGAGKLGGGVLLLCGQ